VTIISPTKISASEAYRVFESVMEVHGYSTVVAGKVIKIVPSTDARTKSIETRLKEEAASPEDRVVTQLIPLKYADPDTIKRLFTPLVSKSSVILSYPPTNMLIVTDVYSNIQRLLRIIGAIDITGIGQEISVIPIEYGDAANMVKLLGGVFQTKQKVRKGSTSAQIKFVADERTNSVVLLASEVDSERIRRLIGMLDKQVPKGKEKIHVVYLENAKAEEMAEVLLALPSKEAEKAAGKGKKASPVVSEKVKITADKATNSLIIMAEKDDFVVLAEVIKKLDIPRSMVYIECLLMEVNVEKDFNLGTEWLAVGEASHDGTDGGYGGGFSGGGDVPYDDIAGLVVGDSTTGSGSFPSGFSLGLFSEALEIGGVLYPNLAAIVQAFKKDEDIHILSTPQILTTDNEEAKITVGKNIPYQTKSGSSDIESYNTYEYKDVGISMTITPQISQDRLVRLTISEEITSLDQLASTVEERPTTFKRAIETTVVVPDGNTVVIGGLIDDSFSVIENKIPCLGDIPGAGWLFKSVSKAQDKTNLFLFLTPRVVRSPSEAQAIYEQKKGDIDAVKGGNIKMFDETQTDSE